MDFSIFISQFAPGLHTAGRFRTYSAHKSALNSLKKFCGGHIPTLKEIYNKDFLGRYEKFLLGANRKGNTISFYMTVLRSIYGVAIEQSCLPYTHNLFSGVFTGNDPTKKRALSPAEIARIYSADLSFSPRLQCCRDWFILSFLLQGMSFCDLAHLRKGDLQGNVISYRRQKTQTQINVPILPEAREILDRYMPLAGDSPYLLPLISLTGEEGYKQYQSTIHRQNRQLKELGAFIGLDEELTSYVARHSWATIAYHNGVYISLVSQAMGHHTEEITRIYLDSFKYQEIYEANQTVLSVILNHIPQEEANPQKETQLQTPTEKERENQESREAGENREDDERKTEIIPENPITPEIMKARQRRTLLHNPHVTTLPPKKFRRKPTMYKKDKTDLQIKQNRT